jgi:CelD/BcsL family acetyltransferase involved in cellulose biosynthesis
LPTTLPAARESGARDLRVREIEPHADSRWDAFVASHAGSLVYLHSTWLSALAHEYGQPIVGLACEDATGELRGVLPLMLTQGLPGARLLPAGAEPRLASLPRTPIAGPLADGPDATSLLLGEAID